MLARASLSLALLAALTGCPRPTAPATPAPPAPPPTNSGATPPPATTPAPAASPSPSLETAPSPSPAAAPGSSPTPTPTPEPPKAPAAQGIAGSSCDPPATWIAYQHPAGFALRYPKGWTLQTKDAALLMLPGDCDRDAQGRPNELYLLTAQPAEGVSRVDEADVVAFVDQLAKAEFGAVRQGQLAATEGRGGTLGVARYTRQGSQAELDIYVRLTGGQGVLLAALGERTRLDARALNLLRVAASVGYAPPPRDQRLVGRWRWTKARVSGGFTMTSEELLDLEANGACRRKTQTAGGGGSGTLSSERPWRHGSWSTKGKTLRLTWSDGSWEEWPFICDGTTLGLKGSSKSRYLYDRIR